MEPDNKLLILGSVAGVLATLVLLVALYVPHYTLMRVSPSLALPPSPPCLLATHRRYAGTCS